jgi:class 3 adenylate cyclase/streptogramin lyase
MAQSRAATEGERVAQSSSGSAGTNGFLFCDLRGYTSYVERRGDQAAAELLATYRTLVRAAIAAHTGAEIKTEGDSVYVVFPAASAAVEAGLEIVAAAAEASTRETPIRVGVGIHAGETVATTEGLVGGAVNIAARVCAKAQAGEVLVTDTVRALTRTYLPYRYTSLGTQTLKGIAGGIPLFRVEAVPSSARERLARQLGARRGRLVILTGLLVVALVAAGGAWALNRPADCLTLPASTKDVVAKIDPARGCVVATYGVGRHPSAIVWAADAAWVGNVDDHTISRVDGRTGSSTTVGADGTPVGMAVGSGSIWVLDLEDRLLEFTLESGQITSQRLPAGSDPLVFAGYAGIAFQSNRIWLTRPRSGDVLRSSSAGRAVALPLSYTTTIHVADAEPLSLGPSSGIGPIAATDGALWIADTSGASLFRIDVANPASTGSVLDVDHGGSIAVSPMHDTLWLVRTDGWLTRYDTGSGASQSFRVVDAATAVAADEHVVWAADLLHATIAKVDPASGLTLTTIKVGGRPAGIAIAPDGSVWVSIQGP